MMPIHKTLLPVAFSWQVASIPWYLDDGGEVTLANVVGAWAGAGAASAEDAKINLANPGTYTLSGPAGDPSWDAVDGWDSLGSRYWDLGFIPPNQSSVDRSMLIRTVFKASYSGTELVGLGGALATGGGNNFEIDSGRRSSDDLELLTLYQGGNFASLFRFGLPHQYVGGDRVYGLLSDGFYIDTTRTNFGFFFTLQPTNLNLFMMATNSNGSPVKIAPSGMKFKAFAIYNIGLSDAAYLSIQSKMAAL